MCVYSISSHNTEMEDKSRLAQKSILIGYDTIRMTLLYRTIYDHLQYVHTIHNFLNTIRYVSCMDDIDNYGP